MLKWLEEKQTKTIECYVTIVVEGGTVCGGNATQIQMACLWSHIGDRGILQSHRGRNTGSTIA